MVGKTVGVAAVDTISFEMDMFRWDAAFTERGILGRVVKVHVSDGP